jgi:hypothetical protein
MVMLLRPLFSRGRAPLVAIKSHKSFPDAAFAQFQRLIIAGFPQSVEIQFSRANGIGILG